MAVAKITELANKAAIVIGILKRRQWKNIATRVKDAPTPAPNLWESSAKKYPAPKVPTTKVIRSTIEGIANFFFLTKNSANPQDSKANIKKAKDVFKFDKILIIFIVFLEDSCLMLNEEKKEGSRPRVEPWVI